MSEYGIAEAFARHFLSQEPLMVDICCKIPVEIRNSLMKVSERRGLTMDELLCRAVVDYVVNELAYPRSDDADQFLANPSVTSLDETPLNRTTNLRRFPRGSDCPEDKIDKWIEALSSDLVVMRRYLSENEAAHSPEGGPLQGVPADRPVVQRVIEKYETLLLELDQRKQRR